MRTTERQKYLPLDGEAGIDNESLQTGAIILGEHPVPCSRRGPTALLVALLLLFNTGFVVWAAVKLQSLGATRDQHYDMSARDCLKKTSFYSPILDQAQVHTVLQTTQGQLEDNTSIWRQPPSPQVDAAWDYITAEDMQLVTVSAEDIIKAGKDPSISVRAPPSWARGDDAYIAQVEVFHHLHCLNELRKNVFHDYYFSGPPSKLHQSHLHHCIHILMQVLTCNADAGIITHYWVHSELYTEPKTRPFPDFNTNKKCRDFDALMRWLRADGGVANLSSKLPLHPPEGAPVMPGDGYAIHNGG